MCIVFIAISPTPKIKFALAMNRDESFLRETASLQYWDDLDMYCGKDLGRGGTWLAVNKKGRFALVTNIRKRESLPTNTKQSRGLIPLELLKRDTFDPLEWKYHIQSLDCENFNVIFGDLNTKLPKVYSYSSETLQLIELSEASKTLSLANDSIDSAWEKQIRGERLIDGLIKSNNLSQHTLFSVLTNDTTSFLNSDNYTEWPIFVKSSNSRGTVSSSVILVDHEGNVDFVEKTWNENRDVINESRVHFSVIK